MTPRSKSFPYRLAETVLRPAFMALTRRDWKGAEHLPLDRGFVACANHISYADTITVAHFLNDNGCPPRILAKESLFHLPVIGPVMRGAGQIPVRRATADASKAFSAAVEAVEAGECVVVFPEGTLTRDPDLWPMTGKTGAARIALATGCPVIPLGQWGAQDILAPYGKVPHLLGRKTSHVWAGAPVDLADLHRGGATDAASLRAATDRIMDHITTLVEEIRQEQRPAARFDPRKRTGGGAEAS